MLTTSSVLHRVPSAAVARRLAAIDRLAALIALHRDLPQSAPIAWGELA
ncbi:hypothetical protein [Halochromatium glycolicum]|nr:hypothetical protein [Halochromatium glycolicum]